MAFFGVKPHTTFKKKWDVGEMINGLNEYVEQDGWKGYRLNNFSGCKCK